MALRFRPLRGLGVAAALVCAAAAVVPASAQDIVTAAAGGPGAGFQGDDLVFDLGLGGELQPSFEGASTYAVLPYPIFSLTYLRLPFFGEVANGKKTAISIYPSFNYIGSRSCSDAHYLCGLPNVDAAIEVGPGISIQRGPIRGFAEVRYGFTGHNGVVADFGLDYVWQPLDRLNISFGPRASVASDKYMDTYFGVPLYSSRVSGLRPYNPGAGFKDAGLGLRAVYDLTSRVKLYGEGTWKHFVGDAADSPIVKRGAEDQFTLGIGVSYRFGFRLH